MMEGTYLQIDLQNLFLSALRGQRLDFEKIWDHFASRETEVLTGATIYTVRGSDFDSSRFETKLHSLGYEVKMKNLPKMSLRPKTAPVVSHDIQITIDCMTKLDRFGKWILMSNNVEFVDLCRYLRSIGKKVELWAFKDNYDPIFDTSVDRIHFLDEDFCLKKSPVSVFGINWGLEKFEGILDSTSMESII